jgi:hypothetical protein
LTYNKAALETIKKIYIYSNGCHLEWMVRLSDIILKGAHKDHPPKKNWFKLKSNLAGMVLWWVPFKSVSDSPALHLRWLLLLKIEISSIFHCFLL